MGGRIRHILTKHSVGVMVKRWVYLHCDFMAPAPPQPKFPHGRHGITAARQRVTSDVIKRSTAATARTVGA